MGEEKKGRRPFGERLSGFLKTKKGQKILVALLVAAAAFVILSDSFGGETRQPSSEDETMMSDEEYEAALESRLREILESMSGVGSCSVMVTLTGSSETVFVTENKYSEDSEKNADGSEKNSHQSEENCIIIEDESGGQTALSSKYIRPEVAGVLVVCDGGTSPAVREKVVNAVKTALKIGSDRIYVTDRG